MTARKSKEAEFNARLLSMEQRSARPDGAGGGMRSGKSLGDEVEAAFAQGNARDLLAKTGRLQLEVNAGNTCATVGAHGSVDTPTARAG